MSFTLKFNDLKDFYCWTLIKWPPVLPIKSLGSSLRFQGNESSNIKLNGDGQLFISQAFIAIPTMNRQTADHWP